MARSIIRKQDITGLGESWSGIASSIISDINTSFNNASDYHNFSGYTTAASEAGWYGFKHTNAKGGMAIFFSRNLGAFIISRSASGTWTGRKLCNWGGVTKGLQLRARCSGAQHEERDPQKYQIRCLFRNIHGYRKQAADPDQQHAGF